MQVPNHDSGVECATFTCSYAPYNARPRFQTIPRRSNEKNRHFKEPISPTGASNGRVVSVAFKVMVRKCELLLTSTVSSSFRVLIQPLSQGILNSGWPLGCANACCGTTPFQSIKLTGSSTARHLMDDGPEIEPASPFHVDDVFELKLILKLTEVFAIHQVLLNLHEKVICNKTASIVSTARRPPIGITRFWLS